MKGSKLKGQHGGIFKAIDVVRSTITALLAEDISYFFPGLSFLRWKKVPR